MSGIGKQTLQREVSVIFSLCGNGIKCVNGKCVDYAPWTFVCLFWTHNLLFC